MQCVSNDRFSKSCIIRLRLDEVVDQLSFIFFLFFSRDEFPGVEREKEEGTFDIKKKRKKKKIQKKMRKADNGNSLYV